VCVCTHGYDALLYYSSDVVFWRFVCVVVAKCIDLYIKQRVHNAECDASDFKMIEQSLENVVNRMFQRCYDDRQFKQVR
jgi:hypothetical protein